MKAIGIVGYSKSGKTTLLVKLAHELANRGHKVATVKHAPKGIDTINKDTEKHKKVAQIVAAISGNESVLFFKGIHALEDILKYIKSDYVIVEGFKQEKTFPKILCVKNKTDADELSDGLEIAAFGADLNLTIPVINDIKQLCNMVEKKAFKLPKLDCGACGFSNCYQLAKEIVKENKKLSDCKSLQPETKITIDGTLLPLNPFISEVVRNTIIGMLSSLKSYKPGNVEIEISGT